MTGLGQSMLAVMRVVERNMAQLSDDPNGLDADELRLNIVFNAETAARTDLYWQVTLYGFERAGNEFSSKALVVGSGNDSVGPVNTTVEYFGCAELSGDASSPAKEWTVSDTECPDWLLEAFREQHLDAVLKSVEESLEGVDVYW